MNNRVILLDITEAEDSEYILAHTPNAEVVKRAEDAAVISVVWTRVNPSNYPSLRFIVNRSMGRDHIDFRALEAAGVLLLEVGDYCSKEIAAYVTRIVRHDIPLGHGVCVVGVGRIGGKVADELNSAGYRVTCLHHDSMDWDILMAFKECACITLHLPLTNQSRGWLNWTRMRALRGATLINTARAGLIKDEDLLSGLDKGHIKAAYLDVAGAKVREHPSVIWTKHRAFQSESSKALRAKYTVKLLKEALDGVHVSKY